MQIRLTLADLDELHYGEVMDLLIESGNDFADYEPAARRADQADFDAF